MTKIFRNFKNNSTFREMLDPAMLDWETSPLKTVVNYFNPPHIDLEPPCVPCRTSLCIWTHLTLIWSLHVFHAEHLSAFHRFQGSPVCVVSSIQCLGLLPKKHAEKFGSGIRVVGGDTFPPIHSRIFSLIVLCKVQIYLLFPVSEASAEIFIITTI